MNTNKWLLFAGIGALVLMNLSLACAGNVKIGLIDTQRIMLESKAAKQARNVFLKDLQKKRQVLKSKMEDVLAMEKKLKREAKDLSQAARKEIQETLAKEIKDLRRLRADLEEELKKKDLELTRKLLVEIREIVGDFSKERGYTVILEKKSVVAADETIDITEKIIGLYDALKE